MCGGAVTLTLRAQVLFLDADNMAVADPAPLFDARGARDTGALLWPDYWAATAAPDLAAVLGLAALPAASFESGQMLFDKRRCAPARPRRCAGGRACAPCHARCRAATRARPQPGSRETGPALHRERLRPRQAPTQLWLGGAAPGYRRPVVMPTLSYPNPMSQARSVWDALLLAAYMNLRAGLYFELLSCYMGKGDKETFAAALAVVGAPYTVIPTPVGSAGVMHTYCRRGPAPWLPEWRTQRAVCCQACAKRAM
jgi:hypothetical protein